MLTSNPLKATLTAAIGLLWCIIVLAAYYIFNAPYYAEKINTFGRFFGTLLGL